MLDFVEKCVDNVKENDDNTVTIPISLYNVLMQMIQQQNTMMIEIQQLRINLKQHTQQQDA